VGVDSKRWRALGILTVAFFGLYAAASVTQHDGWGWVPKALLLALPAGLIGRSLQRSRAAEKVNLAAVQALAREQYAEALAGFQQVYAAQPHSHAAGYNVGWAQLQCFQLREAAATLESVQQADSGAIELMGKAVPALALVHALLGDREAHQRWDVLSQSLMAESEPLAVLAQAVMASRDSRWEDIRDLLRAQDPAALGGRTRALADALLAWSQLQLHGHQRPLKVEAILGDRGAEVLRQTWPSFVEFVGRSALN
jgi:tetratricopeptide (TPR) repeat protein